MEELLMQYMDTTNTHYVTVKLKGTLRTTAAGGTYQWYFGWLFSSQAHNGNALMLHLAEKKKKTQKQSELLISMQHLWSENPTTDFCLPCVL